MLNTDKDSNKKQNDDNVCLDVSQLKKDGCESLKKYCEALGLTQEQFSEKFSANGRTLSQLGQGVYPPPSYIINALNDCENVSELIVERDKTSDIGACVRLGKYFKMIHDGNATAVNK